MQLLYDLLQIPPCPKWNIFKRIKTHFRIRKIKKEISKDIHNLDYFFKNIVDFCTFMEHIKTNFNIPQSDNYSCKILYYNTVLTTYILQFNTSYGSNESRVSIIYRSDETDRINVKLFTTLKYSEIGYDVYLESDKLESYKNDDLKNEIILFTMQYMDSEIIKTIDSIVNKYIMQRKDTYHENEQEKVQ